MTNENDKNDDRYEYIDLELDVVEPEPIPPSDPPMSYREWYDQLDRRLDVVLERIRQRSIN